MRELSSSRAGGTSVAHETMADARNEDRHDEGVEQCVAVQQQADPDEHASLGSGSLARGEAERPEIHPIGPAMISAASRRDGARI